MYLVPLKTQYRHILFYCALQFFANSGNSALSKSVGFIFFNSIFWFLASVSQFNKSHISNLLYLLRWSIISGPWWYSYFGSATNPIQKANLINKCGVCSGCFTDQVFLSLLLLRPPCSLRDNRFCVFFFPPHS